MTTKQLLYIVTDTDCDCGNLFVTFPQRFSVGNSFNYGIIHFMIITAVMGENLCQRLNNDKKLYPVYIEWCSLYRMRTTHLLCSLVSQTLFSNIFGQYIRKKGLVHETTSHALLLA